MVLKLPLDLPEDETCVRTTRLLSRILLEDIEVVKPDIDAVETIVSELCSNVVRHAHSKEKHLHVVLEYYEPKVIISVTDAGEGFVQEDVLPAGTVRSDRKGGERIGDYGLFLLEGLSDKVDFTATDPHGTTVRAEKHLHYETQGDADEAAGRDTGSGGDVIAQTQ